MAMMMTVTKIDEVEDSNVNISTSVKDESSVNVLQCCKCGLTFGDTSPSHFVDFDINSKITVINKTTKNISEGKLKFISEDDYDTGCLFVDLSCVKCRVEVGRKYMAVSKSRVSWSECSAFYYDTLKMYQIKMKASSGVGTTNVNSHISDIWKEIQVLSQRVEMVNSDVTGNQKEIQDLYRRVEMLSEIIMTMNQRLSCIERFVLKSRHEEKGVKRRRQVENIDQ